MRLQVQLGHSAHTMPAPFKAITVSQPVAGARCLGRPLQRAMRVMAAQQRQQDLLSADEVAKAMEFQRRRSQVKAAGAPQAAVASLQVDRCTVVPLAQRFSACGLTGMPSPAPQPWHVPAVHWRMTWQLGGSRPARGSRPIWYAAPACAMY